MGEIHPSRIIFGSCNSLHFEQPFWNVISKRDPTAFVWAGDAVYADDRLSKFEGGMTVDDGRQWWMSSIQQFWRRHRILDATPEYLHKLYQEQRSVPGYKDMIDSGRISIFGTIDDHDYGTNNGDKTFPWKRESAIEFVKFLGLDELTSAMARRAYQGKGIYGVAVYDFSSQRDPTQRLLSDEEAGLDPDVVLVDGESNADRDNEHSDGDDNQLVAVFVLDVRSNKSPWSKSFPRRFFADPEGDFLGSAQWEWFETAIGRSKAAVNIIVSGLQAHAPWFYDGNLVENWSGFPQAQHRLYQAILQPNVRAPLLVTGDIHLSQFLRKDCRRMVHTSDEKSKIASSTTIRPLYEVTTSGMTHSWGSARTSVCGRPNISWLCHFYPYNAFTGTFLSLAHWISPWTALLLDGRSKLPQYSLARNIAEFEIDWFQRFVTVRILGDDGGVLLRQDWSMDLLNGKTDTSLLDRKSFEVAHQRLESTIKTAFPVNGNKEKEYYVCVNYRGNPNQLQVVLSFASLVGLLVIAVIYPFLFCYGILFKVMPRRYSRRSKIRNQEVVTRPKKD